MSTLPEITNLTFPELGEVIRLCQERQTQLRDEIRVRLKSEAELIGMKVIDNGASKPRGKRPAKQAE